MKSKKKYMEVYIGTKEKIQSGEYPIGSIIPSGEELAKIYNCSKLTVKKGLDILVRDGMIVRRRGQGTTVLRKYEAKSLPTLGLSHGLYNTYGKDRISSEINCFEIILPAEDIADKLEIKTNEYVYHIVRTRFLDELVYSWEETYMPLSIVPGLTEDVLKHSIYNYLQKDLELTTEVSHVWIHGENANSQDVKFLKIEPSDFIINIEKIATLNTGTVFEYSKTRHKYDRFVFESFIIHN